jgi:hypothetical protein
LTQPSTRRRLRRRSTTRRLLKLLWAAPASILGLALAPFFARRSVRDGVLVCEGAAWPARLGWRYKAMTLGHVIVCVGELDQRTWEHELVHVRQHEAWGPLFVPAYVAASAWAMLRGRHFYQDNRFEVAARRRGGGG